MKKRKGKINNNKPKSKSAGEKLADWFSGGAKGRAPGLNKDKHRRRVKINFGKVPF